MKRTVFSFLAAVLRRLASRAAGAAVLAAVAGAGGLALAPVAEAAPPVLETRDCAGLRLPAVPLVTHDPFFSAWSRTDTLNASWPAHWTGANFGLCVMLAVDGKPYVLCGDPQEKGVARAEQTAVRVSATRTQYVFNAGGVEATLTFTSPLLIDDLDALSRPATYLHVSAANTTGAAKKLRLYADVTGEWAVHFVRDNPRRRERSQRVRFQNISAKSAVADILAIGNADPKILGRAGDFVRIDWGRLLFAADKRDRAAAYTGDVDAARARFIATGALPPSEPPTEIRAASDRWPGLAYAFDLGTAAAAGTGAAPARVRAEVVLPPIAKTGQAAAQATRVSCERIRMSEDKENHRARFDFDDKVYFTGGLRGHCDRLFILADTGREKTDNNAATEARLPSAARILQMNATGNVRLAADNYSAEGGEAVVHPRVALVEAAPSAAAGAAALDGAEPQWLVLRPHPSTPGKRPRISILTEAAAFDIGDPLRGGAGAANTSSANNAQKTGAERKPTGAAADTNAAPRRVPIHIDSDLVEIVRGARRSRFFLRDNVELTAPELDLRGRCDNVEGVISHAAAGGAAPPGAITRIVGRGNVTLDIQGAAAEGRQFEIEPAAHRFQLSGDPRVVSRDGNRVTPGGSILYDWRNRDWQLHGMRAADGGAITRPRITIPLSNFAHPRGQ